MALLAAAFYPARAGEEKINQLAFKDGEAKAEAELTAADPKDSVRKASPRKVFLVKLAKGKTYQIDMTSKKVDSFLRLEDAGGKQLAEDDDGGGALNARILFDCKEDGDYRIIATCVGGGTGSFKLAVKLPGGVKITALGLKDGEAKVEAKLEGSDPKDRARSISNCKIYAIKLAKGKTYQIDMMSKKIDAYLRLEDNGGKQLAEDDDGGGGHDARITFACPADGIYHIIATTYSGETGPFILAVKEK
jgi:hypothetical protein